MDRIFSAQPRKTLMVWAGTGAFMLLPILAEGIDRTMARDPSDFVFLAALWVGTGACYESARRIAPRLAYRAGAAFALVAGFLTLWINLAVGIIGSEDNPANLMFFAIVALALSGSCAARFRARGISIAMLAAALAQALVFVAALLTGHGFTGPVTIFFVALWLASAHSFRTAPRRKVLANG